MSCLQHGEISAHVVRHGEQEDEIEVRVGRMVRVRDRVKEQARRQRGRRPGIQAEIIVRGHGDRRGRGAVARAQPQAQVRRRERVGDESESSNRMAVGRNDQRENVRAIKRDGQIVEL